MEVVAVEIGGKGFDSKALLRKGNDCGTEMTELLLGDWVVLGMDF
jgi:hypothetical protein